MAFCPGCGTQVADGTTFCRPAENRWVRPPVGGGSGSGARSCSGCGSPLVRAWPIMLLACSAIALSSLGLICDVIFLVTDPFKSNKFIRFHAFQSLFLHASVFRHGHRLLRPQHGSGRGLLPARCDCRTVELLIWLGALVLVVMMMVKAYNLQTPHLPIIGAMADKQV